MDMTNDSKRRYNESRERWSQSFGLVRVKEGGRREPMMSRGRARSEGVDKD